MISFYQIYTRYKGGEEIHNDTITTAASLKEAEEDAKGSLSGSDADDGSLPEFVKAVRISREAARKLYDQNPIDWINHDEMRQYLD
jgi:hypothetical protein